MMQEKKNYKITIFGETYSLLSDETDHHISTVSQLVDSLMNEISLKIPQASTEKIAVLVALQLASQLTHSNELLQKYQQHNALLIDHITQELQR